MSYSYAGGIDRPLVITKEAVATVIPHQNWRGMFANATTTTGALSGVAVNWPGFQTTPWHKTRSSVQNWFGSVATGMRDGSGLIYMRNRYYDPSTGQFTQPDPIGLEGGLNSYGFAAGDPISYRDPYGLWIYCVNQLACKTIDRVLDDARDAFLSDDRHVRRAGQNIRFLIGRLRSSPKMFAVHVVPWATAGYNRAGRCVRVTEDCVAGATAAARVGMNHIRWIDGRVRLVHELGHVYHHEIVGTPWTENSQVAAIGWENEYRTLRGCRERTPWFGPTGEALEGGDPGPPCHR